MSGCRGKGRDSRKGGGKLLRGRVSKGRGRRKRGGQAEYRGEVKSEDGGGDREGRQGTDGREGQEWVKIMIIEWSYRLIGRLNVYNEWLSDISVFVEIYRFMNVW